MPLYPHQDRQVNEARKKLRTCNNLLFQLPTGGGKTAIVAELTFRALQRGFTSWFIVPRNELLNQASMHYLKWEVPHGIIGVGRKESRAFKVHVVSRQTLVRRYDKIKNWPDIMFIDEVHIAVTRQLEIIKLCNQARAAIGKPPVKVIGLTATPELLCGLGLHVQGGGPYEDIVIGESIPSLTSMGYLSPLRYFRPPPPEGIDKLHCKGTELDANELDQLLKKKKIYGDAIEHYRKKGGIEKISYSFPGNPTLQHNKNYHKGKPALIFLRSVLAAHEMAEQFRNAGYEFHCIEGKMKRGKIKTLIQAHRDGKIDGLTNCDIGTYGLDIPRIEYSASLRPTLSRALYFQKVGRGLRPFEERYCRQCKKIYYGYICNQCKSKGDLVYKKEESLFFDHVGLIDEHYDYRYPGVPLFYINDIEWNFYGTKKRERMKKPDRSINCPYIDYMLCAKKSCVGCKYLPENATQKKPVIEIINTELVETKKPVQMSDRPPEEQKKYTEMIAANIQEYVNNNGNPDPGPVERLLKIAEELGYSVMWVYHRLAKAKITRDSQEETQGKNKAIDVQLLFMIARIKKFKKANGWVYYARKRLEGRIK